MYKNGDHGTVLPPGVKSLAKKDWLGLQTGGRQALGLVCLQIVW